MTFRANIDNQKRWLELPRYVRVTLLIAFTSFFIWSGVGMYLNGSAEWGFANQGHYFVARGFRFNAHEVSFYAWQASKISEYFLIASWVCVIFTVVFHAFRGHKQA